MVIREIFPGGELRQVRGTGNAPVASAGAAITRAERTSIDVVFDPSSRDPRVCAANHGVAAGASAGARDRRKSGRSGHA